MTGDDFAETLTTRLGGAPAALLALVLVCAALFLPGIAAIPPLDRDEPRFTQASRQMLETGDYVDIRFQNEPRHKKPAGIYWLQAAAVAIIGGPRDRIWKYRTVSVVGATAAVLLTFWLARIFLGPVPALLTALLLASTILLGVEAHIAKTDAMLLATIVGAQALLARSWRDPAPLPVGWSLVFWSLLGAGFLIKGPIIVMIVGLTALALVLWQRDARFLLRLRPLGGIAVFALVVAPWFLAIAARTEFAFFDEALGRDLFGKLATGQESHGAPPGVHLAVMIATFWPATPFLGLGLAGLRRALDRPAVRFALCWAVPNLIVFELSATKLPHYVLPIFPALALLTMALLDHDGEWTPPRLLTRLMAGLLAAPTVAVFAGAFALPLVLGDRITWPAVAILGLAVIAGLAAARRLLQRPGRRAIALAAVAAVLVNIGAYGFMLPALSGLWISSRIVAMARATALCPDPRIVSVGWREPSLVFLGGTDTGLKTPAGAVEDIAGGGCIALALSEADRAAFIAGAGPAFETLEPVGTITGFALNGGDRVSLEMYRTIGRR